MESEQRPNRTTVRHPDARVPAPQRVIDEPKSEHAPSPRKYEPPPNLPRRKWWSFKKIVVILLFLAMVGLILYVGYIVSIVAKISTNTWQLGPLETDANGRTNILILGVGDAGHAGEKLSDSMMVLSLKGSNRSARISIPRDLRVEIPEYGESKINAAHAYGGVQLAEQTVSNNLGIPIHYYVRTNFTGLKTVVDSIGGVEVDVKKALVDVEYPCEDNQYRACGLNIRPGVQHMDGTTALQYVRCRKGTCGNDFGRAERQQEVMNLVIARLLKPDNLVDLKLLNQVALALQQGVQTDLGGIQMVQLARVLMQSPQDSAGNFVLSTSPGGLLRSDPVGSSDLVPLGGNFSAIEQKINGIFE